jgi:hypothetical protein
MALFNKNEIYFFKILIGIQRIQNYADRNAHFAEDFCGKGSCRTKMRCNHETHEKGYQNLKRLSLYNKNTRQHHQKHKFSSPPAFFFKI